MATSRQKFLRRMIAHSIRREVIYLIRAGVEVLGVDYTVEENVGHIQHLLDTAVATIKSGDLSRAADLLADAATSCLAWRHAVLAGRDE